MLQFETRLPDFRFRMYWNNMIYGFALDLVRFYQIFFSMDLSCFHTFTLDIVLCSYIEIGRLLSNHSLTSKVLACVCRHTTLKVT